MTAKAIIDYLGKSDLKAGDKLPSEVVMAERLGVSRATLREVYRQLQSLGYIDLVNGRGAFFRERNPDLIQEAFGWFRTNEAKLKDYLEVRLSFDPLAARLASERRTDEDIIVLQSIENAFEDAVAKKDNMMMAKYDAQFHEKIVNITQNELLRALVKIVNSFFEQTRETSFRIEEHAEHAIEPHRTILKAIKEGNQELASAASYAHMKRSLHDICGDDL